MRQRQQIRDATGATTFDRYTFEVDRPTRWACEAGRLLDDFADVVMWTASGAGAVAAYTTDTERPTAMKITAPAGTYTQVSRDLTLDARGRFLSFLLKPLDAQFDRMSFGISVAGRSYTNRYENEVKPSSLTVANRWHRVTIPMAQLSPGGSATASMLSDVRNVRFEAYAKAGTNAEILVADFRVHDDPVGPGIVFIFDDAHDSTYDEAFPVMQAAGFLGCVAVETSNVGNANRCSLAELQEMHTAGWDMASHTKSGGQLSSADMAAVRTQLRDSYTYLVTNGLTRGSRFFVYPGGTWDETILKEVLVHYDAARVASNQNFNAPFVADRGLIRPWYFTNSTTLAAAQAAVDRVVERGGLAVMTFHDLVTTPSANEDWSIANFSSLIDYIAAADVAVYRPSDVFLP